MPLPGEHSEADAADAALREAIARILSPVAELSLAKGLRYAVVEEMLKRAFVQSARDQSSAKAVQRDISRVSAATGLTRREVTRITLDETTHAALRPSPATQIFTKWMGNRRLHDAQGNPRPLKRQGRSPSFEALAQSVTRDVHPRTLLEELCRLGLAKVDEDNDMVMLVRDAFVPKRDKARLFSLLGNNVGDHLSAAVDNVIADSPPHVEQAIFADELSEQSVAKVREMVNAEWKKLLADMVPKISAMIDEDAKLERAADQRLRVGLYSYRAAMDIAPKEPSEE